MESRYTTCGSELTITLEARLDPPKFAAIGAERWTTRNAERSGAVPYVRVVNIEETIVSGFSWPVVGSDSPSWVRGVVAGDTSVFMSSGKASRTTREGFYMSP